MMTVNPEDLSALVRYALETTRATAVCPFHDDITIRIGDDAAEGHALERAKRIVRSDGKVWDREALRKEFKHQLGQAADRYCPRCAGSNTPGQPNHENGEGR